MALFVDAILTYRREKERLNIEWAYKPTMSDEDREVEIESDVSFQSSFKKLL